MAIPFSIDELQRLNHLTNPNQTIFGYRKNPLVLRAIDAGLVDSERPQWTARGEQHVQRLALLSTAILMTERSNKNAPLSVFRTSDYPTAAAAAEDGALYSLPLPIGGTLTKQQLQEIQSVIRAVSDSLADDPNLLQLNQQSADGVWHDMTGVLERDILAELIEYTPPRQTIDAGTHLQQISQLVIVRAHDYEPTATGLSQAAEDGALRALPIGIEPLQTANMGPEVFTWLHTLEEVAKAAGRCIDSNTEMQLAIETVPSYGLYAQYTALDDLKSAYCRHPQYSSPIDLVDAEMKHATDIMVMQQDPDANTSHAFALKALHAMESYAIFSEKPDAPLWRDYISAIMEYAPDGVSAQDLSQALPFDSFKKVCELISESADSVVATAELEMLSTLVLRHASQVLDHARTPVLQQRIEHSAAPDPQPHPAAPSMRRT